MFLQGEPCDLVPPLRAYLSANFTARDVTDAAEDLTEINSMRSDVVRGALTGDARRELPGGGCVGRRAGRAA